MKTPTFFLIAGEKSGDDLGQKLVESLYRKFPKCRVVGIGGPKMRSAGLHSFIPMEELQVMGFIDVLLAFPKIYRLFKRLRKHLLESPPDFLVTIDYPGFNLALARSLRKKKFPGKICHYVCPSVWAWGKKRIPKMEEALDALFVTFPFEEHLFNSNKLDVHYVGHPLVRKISQEQISPIDIDPKLNVLALFPGSREKELHRNFPLQLKVISRLLDQYPDLFIAVSVSQPRFSLILDQLTKQQNFTKRSRMLFVDASQNSALMKRADLAIAKSGTVNLELALNNVPTVVTYGIGPLDLFIARDILRIRLPHYSLPNIVAGERVFPELIGPNFTEEALFREANHFLSNPENLSSCREKCAKLVKLLEEKLPEGKIADVFKAWTH